MTVLVFQRLLRFAITSGAGLGIDFGVFMALTAMGVPSGWANLASATTGVTFVYFASVRAVFSYKGERLVQLFVAYLCYQAVAVTMASWAVGALASIIYPFAAKLAILPFTFSANYAFMHVITQSRRRAVAEIEGA